MKRYFLTIAAAFLVSPLALANVELAKIGAKSITEADLRKALEGMPEGPRQQFNTDENVRGRVLNSIVVEELLVQEAEKGGVTRDKEFQAALERSRRQLLMQRYMQRTVQPQMTDANVKAFFDKNRTRYSQDEVKAHHVLVQTEAEAREVLQKARAGEDIEVLAKKFSKDPSVSQNMGDLGFFTRDRMLPAFSEAAFKLKKGEISNPVQTVFGWHVIKLSDRKDGKPVKFEDVKERVRSDLQSDSIDKLISGLKQSNKVSVFEDRLKGVKL
jgi:peptidyl-prolyl cis-trans isomerase C